MAEKTNAPNETRSFAKDIYSQMVAMSGGIANRQMAIRAFRAAEEFALVESGIANGELEVNPKADWGADCEAPNMPDMHPVNLLSSTRNAAKKGANRELVNRIHKWLLTHPDPDAAYKDESGHWGWSKDETKTARKLFPDFADSK
jgi:hypothetical protein